MIRRTARLRREFIYRKSLEGKERELYEKKRTIRQCLEVRAGATVGCSASTSVTGALSHSCPKTTRTHTREFRVTRGVVCAALFMCGRRQRVRVALCFGCEFSTGGSLHTTPGGGGTLDCGVIWTIHRPSSSGCACDDHTPPYGGCRHSRGVSLDAYMDVLQQVFFWQKSSLQSFFGKVLAKLFHSAVSCVKCQPLPGGRESHPDGAAAAGDQPAQRARAGGRGDGGVGRLGGRRVRQGGGLYKRNAVDPQLEESTGVLFSAKLCLLRPLAGIQRSWSENAWFQPLKLLCDVPVSSLCFQMGHACAATPRRTSATPRCW
jgi:hypothetical protein